MATLTHLFYLIFFSKFIACRKSEEKMYFFTVFTVDILRVVCKKPETDDENMRRTATIYQVPVGTTITDFCLTILAIRHL